MEAEMKHAIDDKLVMLAELTIKAEMLEAFLRYTVQNLALSRQAPGNISFDILLDDVHSNKVFFYEIWESAEAQLAYMAWRVERGDLTVLMSFLAAEPAFTVLRRIAS
jgi:quinol monooxygenase YgiN